MSRAAILCLDTAGPSLHVALAGTGGAVEGYLRLGQPRQHARLLPGAVDRLLELAGVARDQLAAVAAVVGPGSYTGLRVGVAAAQGLAFALQLKAVPLSRLEVLAAGAGPWQGPVLALENARQGRWFRQWFGATREGPSPLGEAACLDGPRLAAEVSGHLQEGPLLVGPEADRCLPAGMEGVAVWPQDGSPHVWCALAWRRWEEGRAVEPVALAPVYLRPPT